VNDPVTHIPVYLFAVDEIVITPAPACLHIRGEMLDKLPGIQVIVVITHRHYVSHVSHHSHSGSCAEQLAGTGRLHRTIRRIRSRRRGVECGDD
jgi:hypothetical protein